MSRLGWVFLGLWVVAAAGGAFWLALQDGRPWQQPGRQWQATRDLPRNHQLREGDIEGPEPRHLLARISKKSSLIGKYLTLARKKGDDVVAENVSTQPQLRPCEPKSGVWLYSLKADELLADGVQTGSWVLLCMAAPGAHSSTQTRCSKGSLVVEAVHRPVEKSDSTWVALRVPSCRYKDVGEYLSRDRRFLLVAANPPPRSEQACSALP